MAQRRLIDMVLRRRLCEDRAQARRLILAGGVFVNGHALAQPAAFVRTDAALTIHRVTRPVSRAGPKLAHAFARWPLHVDGLTAADIGAAAGGFTACLLHHGARRVYAIETGKGRLDWSLRQDPRVVVMENTNALYLEALPEAVRFITIDTSWTPLRRSLPAAGRLLDPGGEVIALLKPNYELQDASGLVDGVLKDARKRDRVVRAFLDWAWTAGWTVLDAEESPLTGDKGNVEWLVHLRQGACGVR